MRLRYAPLELKSRHEFRISRGGRDLFQNVVVELEWQGFLGRGEGAAASYHGETRDTMAAALAAWEPLLGDDPWDRVRLLARLEEARPGNHAALSAVDQALWDLAGQAAGQPVYRLLGLSPDAVPLSSLTLGLAEWPVMERKLEEARDFPILKIKMGVEGDLDLLRRVRARTRQRLTVDANSGWTREVAARRVREVADLGVEMVEQPLAADDVEGLARLRKVSPVPVYADESVCVAADLPRLVGAVDGVNVKLAKTGGLTEALRLVAAARAHGLSVMFGCMVESSLGITAAAHLAPLADHLDLDGHWLLESDPFEGVGGGAGRLVLPERPGLGVRPRVAAAVLGEGSGA
jgi:L-alanine-DL-glutamate epimerase-like enolase superfamily enzyme